MSLSDREKSRQTAAELLARGELTHAEVADAVGVSPQTISAWKKQSGFRSLVEQHRDRFREAVRTHGIALLENRVRAQHDRWVRLQQVIAERAESPEMEGVPGGKTGLLCHTVKGVGKGEDFQLIDIYAVDTGLLAELRNHEKQAAQELGQWAEKRELSGPDGGPIRADLNGRIRLVEVVPIGLEAPAVVDAETVHADSDDSDDADADDSDNAADVGPL